MLLAGVEGLAVAGVLRQAGVAGDRDGGFGGRRPAQLGAYSGKRAVDGQGPDVLLRLTRRRTPPAPVDGCYFSAVPGFPLMDS